MAIVKIYEEESNKTYSVNFDLSKGILSPNVADPNSIGKEEYYLLVYTDMKKYDGSSFGKYVIKSYADVPPLYSAATSFSDLVNGWVQYFIEQTELGMSSSSSSSSSLSSIGYSSSSSSFGKSSSSSSTSSSSSSISLNP